MTEPATPVTHLAGDYKPVVLPQRMRIRKGRVMHRVRRWRSGNIDSLCRRPHGLKGVTSTSPRASGPEHWWTDERFLYPDCEHCPDDKTED